LRKNTPVAVPARFDFRETGISTSCGRQAPLRHLCCFSNLRPEARAIGRKPEMKINNVINVKRAVLRNALWFKFRLGVSILARVNGERQP
jgi:hypothetical protein